MCWWSHKWTKPFVVQDVYRRGVIVKVCIKCNKIKNSQTNANVHAPNFSKETLTQILKVAEVENILETNPLAKLLYKD